MAQKIPDSKEPAKVPIIEEVLNPSEGHWVVQVRMPMGLASNFPDEPWGTLISEIGLPEREWRDYEGYELVEIKRMSGETEDLYWIFQKLPGPLWTSIMRGVTSLVPSKFKKFVRFLEERRVVDPATEPDIPSGNLIMSRVVQEDNTGRAELNNHTETIVSSDALDGELTDTWGVNTTEESLETEGDPVDFGFGVKQGVQRPTGDGKSIHIVENYPADVDGDGIIATLNAEEHDETTGAVIKIQKHLVDASRAETIAAALRGAGYGSLPGNQYVENRPQDLWHTITISARIDTLPETQTWYETGGISLPNVLSEVGIVWNSNIESSTNANGVDNVGVLISGELSWRVSAQGAASGYVTGRPYQKVTGGISGNAQIQVVRTFHNGPPSDTIIARKFEPVYGYVTVRGDQVNVSQSSYKSGFADVNTASGGSSKYNNDSKVILERIGPVEHSGGLTLTDIGDPKTVSETVFASGGTTPSAGIIPSVSFTITAEGVASLELPTSSTPLESGDTYILRVVVRPWRFGIWIREVYTVTVP